MGITKLLFPFVELKVKIGDQSPNYLEKMALKITHMGGQVLRSDENSIDFKIKGNAIISGTPPFITSGTILMVNKTLCAKLRFDYLSYYQILIFTIFGVWSSFVFVRNAQYWSAAGFLLALYFILRTSSYITLFPYRFFSKYFFKV